MEAIQQTFAKCKAAKRAALFSYITAGYPTAEETVDILLSLECGGAGEYFSVDDLDPSLSFDAHQLIHSNLNRCY